MIAEKPGLFQVIRNSLWNPNYKGISTSEISDALYSRIIGSFTESGERVTEYNALKLSIVYMCIKKRSQYIGMLPFSIRKYGTDGSKEVQVNNPIHKLIHERPNPYMSASTFWALTQLREDWRGNAYSFIERDGNFRPKALWPLHPDDVQVFEVGREIQYKYKGDFYPARDILHTFNISLDGKIGISPIHYNAEAIGQHLKLDRYATRSLSHKPAGFLSTEVDPGAEGARRIKENWKSQFDSDAIPILPHSAKFNNIQITPEEAQYIESRKFLKRDIAAIYDMPSTHVGDNENVPYSTAEHQDIFLARYCLAPLARQKEQEINRKLLPESNLTAQEPLYSKVNMNALLRGDTKARTDYYRFMTSAGHMNSDEVRKLEDMNPQPDGQGKRYYVQSGFVPKDRIDDVVDKGEPSQPGNGDGQGGDDNKTISYEDLKDMMEVGVNGNGRH